MCPDTRDANAGDVARVGQPEVRPGLAAVCGLVHAIAVGHIEAHA
jgi:hypothetical protein